MSKLAAQQRRITALSATRVLTVCAVMIALTVVMARLLIPMPNATTRFSLEAVPVFLAGMLCGPLAGGLVGFAADLIGTLFSGYGYNPLFCLPPILYGVCAGLFRTKLRRKPSLAWIAAAFAPAVVFGSVLWQSFTLTWVYGGDAFWPYLTTKLVTRSIQFVITFVLDVLIVFLLQKTGVFEAARLWSPVRSARKEEQR